MTTMLATPGQRVTLKQGGGGRAMRTLIERLFVRDFATMPFDGVGMDRSDVRNSRTRSARGIT